MGGWGGAQEGEERGALGTVSKAQGSKTEGWVSELRQPPERVRGSFADMPFNAGDA